jgi:TRAP-type C4-dicarboxylate transport system permease small subunit
MSRKARRIQMFHRAVDRIIQVFGIVGGFMVCAMIAMTFYECIARYAGHATTWTLELTEYALVYLVFMAVSYAEKHDYHMRVDYFINLLPGKLKNCVELFNYVSIVLFGVLLTYYGIRLSIRSLTSGVVSPTALRFPLFWVHIILPVGMTVMTLKCFLKLLSLMKSKVGAECSS